MFWIVPDRERRLPGRMFRQFYVRHGCHSKAERGTRRIGRAIIAENVSRSACRRAERRQRGQIRERGEQDHEVSRHTVARGHVRRQGLLECAIHRAADDQQQQRLREERGEQDPGDGDTDAPGAVDGDHGLSAVERPHGNQVHEIDERGEARERDPKTISRLQPEKGAKRGSENAGQRPGEAHQGARIRGHALGRPAHIRAEAGNKHRQFGG